MSLVGVCTQLVGGVSLKSSVTAVRGQEGGSWKPDPLSIWVIATGQSV